MKPASRISYGLLLGLCRAVGALPTWFLYHPVLDTIYFFVYKVGRYRLHVVRANLRRAFPEKTDAQRHEIERRFYRHLCEVMVDTLDLINISAGELDQRIRFPNADRVEAEMEGRDWIAALAHYGCWEYFGAYQLHTSAQVAGVYRPLRNKVVDAYYLRMRSRFGLKPVPMHGLLRYVAEQRSKERRVAIGLIADQTPPYPEDEKWFTFLNQPTAFFMGIEKMAMRFGMPVYMMHVEKKARALYEVTFEQIYDGAEPVEPYEITQRYASKLEEMIRREPAWWMWSHRRWKHRPRILDPTVKIVILNWNGAHHLRRFLPGVVAHTPSDIGIVVADNGSTDDSLEVLRRDFPQVEVLELGENYGYAEGYNRALAQLEADFFVLLNSDVEVPPDWIRPLLWTMRYHSPAAAIAPKILSLTDRDTFEYAGAAGGYIDWLGYPFCRGRILKTVEKDRGQYDDARDVFWVSGACMVVNTKIFRELGGFDGGFFAHMEEIDFCWRAQLAGYAVTVNPGSCVYHLGGGTLPNDNPRKLYLNYRNNLSMLYKNLRPGCVEIVLFIRMLLDTLSAFVFLVQGRADLFRVVFRAHRDFHSRRKELKIKRAEIQSNVVTRARHICKSSIVLRYFLGKKTFRK